MKLSEHFSNLPLTHPIAPVLGYHHHVPQSLLGSNSNVVNESKTVPKKVSALVNSLNADLAHYSIM
jgi:hypothetical protein